MVKMTRHDLVEKYAGTKNMPTPEELQEAYGYLDFCYICEKKITFWDRISFNVQHSIIGNCHRRDCGNSE